MQIAHPMWICWELPGHLGNIMAERRLGEFGLTLNPPLWTMLGLEKKKKKISVDRPSTGYQPSCSMGLTVRFSAGELTAMASRQGRWWWQGIGRRGRWWWQGIGRQGRWWWQGIGRRGRGSPLPNRGLHDKILTSPASNGLPRTANADGHWREKGKEAVWRFDTP